jgi:hypothetical protein
VLARTPSLYCAVIVKTGRNAPSPQAIESLSSSTVPGAFGEGGGTSLVALFALDDSCDPFRRAIGDGAERVVVQMA